MQQFLSELAGPGPNEDVFDLCLDHPLISDGHPDKFTSIGGLEAFPALEYLSIAQHQLSDLQGLTTLPQLQELNLSQNELQSLRGLEVQPVLKTLDLTLNELQNLQDFPDLPFLRELHLSHNHLQDIAHLPVLPQLSEINLAGNKQLRDIYALNLQPQLISLNALRLPIKNWNFLDLMPQLRSLVASPHQVDFYKAFSHNSQIRKLSWEIRQLEPRLQLPDLHLLNQLSLKAGKSIRSIHGWEALPKLEKLELNGLPQEIWGSGMDLPKLNTLDLKNMEIPMGVNWNSFPALTKLRLRKAVLKDGALEELKAFKPGLEIEVY